MRRSLVVTAGELARLYAVHRHTVQSWVKAGLPASRPKKARGRERSIDLAAAVRWVRERDRALAEARIAEARAVPDLDAARARKVAAEARIAEANAALREGELVLGAEVEERWLAIADAVREGVLGLAGAAVSAGIVPAARERELEDLCRGALGALAARGEASDAA